MQYPSVSPVDLPSNRSLLARLVRAAVEDIEPIVSRQALAHLAEALPSSAFSRTRTVMLRAAGVKIGAHSLVQGKVRVTGHGNPCELLSIGEGTLVTGGLHVDLGAPIRIGNRVRLGHDVSLLTINHAVGPASLRAGLSYFGEIVIEDGCWLASRCTVLPGVSIGEGSIVAAGSVVTRNVPPRTLVAGVPARVKRDLSEDGEPGPLSVRYESTPPSAVR
ncbi:MAG: transferase hexapeptide repeat containing protein [Polyangiaceae bacterium]|nr:transferase hexapeptide repeat containing protein [Polyangiaceae bacterium]